MKSKRQEKKAPLSRLKNVLIELAKEELPPPGCLRVEGAMMESTGAFSLCGIERILLCTEERVELMGKSKRVSLIGKNLDCLCFRFQTVEVRGTILEILFQERG